MAEEKSYPVCEKLAEHYDEIVILRNFLDFLNEQEIVLGKWSEHPELHEIMESFDSLTHRYFGIDDIELEKERSAMLKSLAGSE